MKAVYAISIIIITTYTYIHIFEVYQPHLFYKHIVLLALEIAGAHRHLLCTPLSDMTNSARGQKTLNV